MALFGMPSSAEQAFAADPAVADLKAEYRSGQVFLTWREAALRTSPEDSRGGVQAGLFNVYVSASPAGISSENLNAATKVGHHIEPHSACDWWQDPASFDKKASPGKPVGFVIDARAPGPQGGQQGGQPLDPAGGAAGLFVYTIPQPGRGNRAPSALFFAVTTSRPDGTEDTTLIRGRNTLADPVACKCEPVQAICQGSGEPIARGVGRGMPLILDLHARGGGIPSPAHPPNFLLFGDESMGWRAGLPFKFTVSITDKVVRLIPLDRAWTGGRPQAEAKDARNDCPAVNTWWFGYNERFYESALAPKKVINNYTERWVLAVPHWAQAYLETDRAATYVTGGSMGGSGAVAMCMHYPKEFAAAWAEVPMVRFATRPVRTLNRLEAVCGPIDESVLAPDGTRLVDYVDGAWQAKHASGDLPYLFVVHGRQDPTIPWVLNPAFYAAMADAQQGMSVYWNDFDHNGAGRHLPPDVDTWDKSLRKYRLDAAFPAFTANSDDRNYGTGDPKDGDLIGWINRGMDWKDVIDADDQFAITILANHLDIVYPVTVTATFRRVQKFRVRAGDKVQARIGGESREVTAGEHGLITIRDAKIADKAGLRVVLRR